MKKSFGIFITVICAIGLISGTNSNLENLELASVFGLQDVEACPGSAINNGRCSLYSNTCFVDPGGSGLNCDSTKGGGGGPTTPPPGGGGGGGNLTSSFLNIGTGN